LDITREQIPVAPAAHYMMGGVRTNTHGETNISGLFAVGEVACTGVHGANRLASNSMLEVLVFAKRAIQRAESGQDGSAENNNESDVFRSSLKKPKAGARVAAPGVTGIQHLMWDKVGIIRDGKNLAEAAETMVSWHRLVSRPSDRHTYELQDLVVAGRLIIEAAMMREESRGAHFRSDFPKTRSEWQKPIIFRKRD
jgi:L-aspartate oxidase